MKKIYTICFALLSLLVVCDLSAQNTNCMDMEQIDNLPGSINDNSAYPAGSILYTDTDMDLYKTYPSGVPGAHTTSLGTTSSAFYFGGWLTLDVSKTNCNNRTLTTEVFCEYIVVDDDTLSTQNLQNAAYTNGKFSASYGSATYTITGNFKKVLFGGSKSRLYTTCINSVNCNLASVSEQQVSASANIYPNPTDGDITIDFGNSAGLVQIFNAFGELIYTSTATSALIVSDLDAAGIYFVHVTRNRFTEVTKLVKR